MYKFFPPSEYALENLKAGQLYFRHFEDYNDPFEIWFNVERGLPELNDNNHRFQKAITAWGFPNSKKDELPLDDETLKEYFGDLAQGAPLFIFDNTRITCFSSEINNLLMWSHYADGLRGFCIEFNENEIFKEDNNTFLVDVIYVDKPPVIDNLEYAVINDQYEFALEHGYEEYEGELRRLELNEIIRNAIASKPEEWKYEKEKRLVLITSNDDKKPIFYSYPIGSIKSIIFGEKMNVYYQEKIIAAVEGFGQPILFKRAVRSKESYIINIIEM